MIFLAIFLIISIVVSCFLMTSDREGLELTGGITVFVAGISLLILFLAWPVSYYDELDKIRRYYSVRDTIATARASDISDIERAALVNQIIDINVWLSQAQHRNTRFFSKDTIPDEVDQLVPLK